jgi:integrase
LLGAEVSHLDLERKTIRIVDGKTEAAKRTLKLRAESMTILASLIQNAEGKYLFSSERDRKRKLSLSTCEKWHNKVLAATGEVNGVKMQGVECVIYDLRHTFGTRSANAGMSLATLARTLGHSSLRSVMKYVHPSQKDMDEALLSLDDEKPSGSAEMVTRRRPKQNAPLVK